MPMNLNFKRKQLGSFLKLRCMVSIYGEENEIVSEVFNVNDLVEFRIKFYTKDSKTALITSIFAIRHEKAKAKDDKVKLKVSCHDLDKPFYSEWICIDIAEKTTIGKKACCDSSLNDVRTCLLDIIVSASKVQDHLLVKLYNDVDFTDFHLASENGSVAVHRAHMAAHSDVFKAMLGNEWKEATEGKVQIKGVTLETLQHLKQYMYLGTLPKAGLRPLLLIALYYLIEDLKAECISTLAQRAKEGDWFSLFEFATENNIPELVCAMTLVNPESALEGTTQNKLTKQVSELKLDN